MRTTGVANEMSLYKKTMAFVLGYIEEHGLAAGDRLPKELDLAAMAGVSMVTVRRALAELAAQGTIRRAQGRGTFVAFPRVRTEPTKIGSLRNTLALDSHSVLETRMLGLSGRRATAAETQALALGDGAMVWELSRLRLLDGLPTIHEVSVIPMILAPDLGMQLDRTEPRSLYEVLEAQYGVSEAREDQALVCRPARRSEIDLLELAASDWVVEIAGISYSAQHVPIDTFRMVFDAKRFSFRLETAQASRVIEAVDVAAPE